MKINKAEITSSVNGEVVFKLNNFHTRCGKREYIEHRHPQLELTIIKDGSGTYTTENGIYNIQKGDVFLFASNESHMITETDEWMTLMNIQFEPRFIWDNGSEIFDIKYLKIFFDRNKNFCNRLDRNNPALEKVREFMCAIEDEFVNKEVGYEHMIKVLLLSVLVTLIRNFDYVNKDRDDYPDNANFSVMGATIDYIKKNLVNQITLADIAKEANMSPSHYCVMFKKLNGISTWEYITAKRIDLAAEKLRTSDLTILNIALMCGFNNTVNFNRAFKKYMGRTPSKYRTDTKSKHKYE